MQNNSNKDGAVYEQAVHFYRVIGDVFVQKRKALGCFGVSILLILLVVLASTFFSMHSRGTGNIQVLSEGDVDAEMLGDVHIAADSFNDIMQKDLQVHLSDDVKVYAAQSSKAYETILVREFHMSAEDAARVAKISGGWTSGRTHITALNGAAGVMDGANERINTTGHELFHQLQYELSNGKDTDEKALFWLEEGSADYIGAHIAEKAGKQSLEKWQLDRINEMRSLQHYAAPQELQHCTLEQRKMLMEQKKHAYQISDLMVIYLLSQEPPEQRYLKLVQYFRELGQTGDGEKAFEKTFNRSVQRFLEDFDRWFKRKMQEPAEIKFVAQRGVSDRQVEEIRRQAALTRNFFRSAWGADLRGEYRIILTADQQDFSKAIASGLAMKETEAAKMAEQSLWVENSSTVFLNAGRLQDQRQEIFSSAAMMTRILQGQTASNAVAGLEWLGRGSAYLVGVQMLGKAGFGTLPQYKEAWLQSIRTANSGVPALKELKTIQDWDKNQSRYGQDLMSNTAELAAAYLAERYGMQSIYQWYLATGELEDAEQAFQQVFGMTTTTFEVEFSHYVVP